MKINAKKYFDEGKKRGLDPYTLSYSFSTETSVEVFNGEVETQQIGTTQDIGAKAIYDGKLGSFGTDAIDEKTAGLMADNILESAKFGKEEKAENFYHGGGRYKKAKTVLPDFKPATLAQIREAALGLCKKIQEKDARLTKVQVNISMIDATSGKENSYGVKCKDAIKCFVGYIELVAEDETKEPRSGSHSFHSFHSLDDLMKEADLILDEAIHSAVDFFKTGPCKSKKYKAVLKPGAVASLLGFYLSQLNAKSVHKHLSLFEGKLNQEIMSKSITMRHTPHVTCGSSGSFDADGHPTTDFTFVQRGVLKTYFHSVETALEDGIESNGCAVGSGNAGPMVVTVTPGKKSLDELFAKMKNGIYITSISGLNSGINAQTLDFSLPCQGYLIKDGKIDKAVSMIACAGNLKDLFNSVVALGSESKYDGGIFTPAFLVKNFAISGK